MRSSVPYSSLKDRIGIAASNFLAEADIPVSDVRSFSVRREIQTFGGIPSHVRVAIPERMSRAKNSGIEMAIYLKNGEETVGRVCRLKFEDNRNFPRNFQKLMEASRKIPPAPSTTILQEKEGVRVFTNAFLREGELEPRMFSCQCSALDGLNPDMICPARGERCAVAMIPGIREVFGLNDQ